MTSEKTLKILDDVFFQACKFYLHWNETAYTEFMDELLKSKNVECINSFVLGRVGKEHLWDILHKIYENDSRLNGIIQFIFDTHVPASMANVRNLFDSVSSITVSFELSMPHKKC